MIGPGVKISNLLLKNCVPEIDNNSINNHRSIMILTLLNSSRQGFSNGTIIRPNFVVREKSKNNLWLRPPGAVPAAEAADSAPVARGYADPYDRSTPPPEPEPPPIFDEIVVQPPPALRAFKTYGDFQPDNDPPSFTDAMRRPDAKLWWDAFCDEIKAIIARHTWSLVDLPPRRRALPLKWVCKTKRDATNVFEKYKGPHSCQRICTRS